MATPQPPVSRSLPNLKDRFWGAAKRVAGELSARPDLVMADLVMEGEAQGTGMPREDRPRPGG